MYLYWGAVCVLFLVVLSLAFVPSVCAEQASAPVIRRIVVRGNTRTREETIRRELLFSTGEPLDSALVEETARNLRQLFFLGNVEIRVQKAEGEAEVLVLVEDLYARALTPTLAGEPRELSYGLIALDYNFLGRGQVVQLAVEHDAVTGNRGEAFYRIPRLMDSRHTLSANLGIGEEGHDVWLSLSRPFYALATRWAYGVSAFTQEQVQRLYANQALSARYTDRLDGGSIWITHSAGGRVKYRSNFSLGVTDNRFASDPGFTYAPDDRRRVLPSVGFTVWQPRYEKTRFVFALGRTEDLQTGSWGTVRAGLSHRGLGSDRDFAFYQAQLAPNFKPHEDVYTFMTFFLSTRQQRGGYANLIASSDARAYARFGGIHTLALRVRWDALSRPEDNSQFLLGSLRGLRGYAIRRFDGSRRFFFNIEARPTFYRHRLFVLAGSLFFDGGTAWTPGRTSRSLNLAAGLGGRMALTRVYNSPILRADLGYGFQDRTWQLTVGLGQYF